jgi:hypothetical protein
VDNLPLLPLTTWPESINCFLSEKESAEVSKQTSGSAESTVTTLLEKHGHLVYHYLHIKRGYSILCGRESRHTFPLCMICVCQC